MVDGATTRSVKTRRTPAEDGSADEGLEETLEGALEEARDVEEQEEIEAALDEVLGEAPDEPTEEEPGEEEAALEAARAGEDEELVAVEPGAESDAVVEVLLRRTGVLPAEAEVETLDEEMRLPVPRRHDEFVCSSCFLIKPRTQLGDPAHNLCRDCLDPPEGQPDR